MQPSLSARGLSPHLRGQWGREARFLNEVDSTNLEAGRWLAGGAPEGALVVADHQTAGRGRSGRTWLGDAGRSLMFSVILRPRVDPSGLGLLTLAFGLACARGIETCTAVAPVIKWPNDLLIGNRKVAGILVETRMREKRLEGAIVGVGINTAWSRDEIPAEISDRATSLAIEGGAPAHGELLAALLAEMERAYVTVTSGRGRDELPELRSRMPMLGTPVSIADPGGGSRRATAVDLAADGALVIEIDGVTTHLYAGDVQTIRPGGPD